MPLVNLTLAIFLKAELGFFGVVVLTCMQTPLLKGEGCTIGLFFTELNAKAKAGDFVFARATFLGFLKSCLNVGIQKDR